MNKHERTLALLTLGAFALAGALAGCSVPVDHAEAAVEAPCGPDEGLVVVDGEIVHGITQCAMCARFEAAYDRRAAELGCDAPFPSEACADEGLEDCYVETIERYTDFGFTVSCENLYAAAALPENYHGFMCGDSCTTTGGGVEVCCPGTPYALRDTCPRWCESVSQCNANSECVALHESL